MCSLSFEKGNTGACKQNACVIRRIYGLTTDLDAQRKRIDLHGSAWSGVRGALSTLEHCCARALVILCSWESELLPNTGSDD